MSTSTSQRYGAGAKEDDHLRGRLRTFRIDRIASVLPRPGTVTGPDDFDPVAHVASVSTSGGMR
jgi:predicted DNA-binding transcriptional regulator YafY